MGTITVDSLAFQFSPGNWKGDTGRGGSIYRQTWNPGAWVKFRFTASGTPTATLLLPTTTTGVTLAIFVNGILTDSVAATGNVTISNLIASAVNDITVYHNGAPQSSRWNNGTNTIQVQGIDLDSASVAGTITPQSKWGLIIGDSITEGIGVSEFIQGYSYYVAQSLNNLGYDVGISACGWSGWIHTGDGNPGDVPGYYVVTNGTYSEPSSRWNKIDQGVSLLDSNSKISSYGSTNTSPDFIWINYGTNEAIYGISTSDMMTSIQSGLTALRTAAPNAWLLMTVPFGLYYNSSYATYVSSIKTAFNNYLSANPTDTKAALLDLGNTFSNVINNSGFIGSDHVHPTERGYAVIAPHVSAFIHQHVLATSSQTVVAKSTPFRRGFW